MLFENDMKTLTEFPSINLKNAAKLKQDLIASGKTAEEVPQALGESLKLEGDRITFLVNALEMVGTRFQDLKRVVICAITEGEKAPNGYTQKGDHFYLVEYFPSLEKKAPQAGAQHSDPKKKKGRGRRGEGKGQGRNERNDRNDRGPRRPAVQVQPKSEGKVVIKPVATPPAQKPE